MSDDHINGYLQWITPKLGDSTYSVLKAHLLFEELLRSYLNRVLPHANALEGSRLTFVQLLAIAKACSPHIEPSHWIWRGIGELNKLRNTLSHETSPKALEEKVQIYLSLIIESTGRPLPQIVDQITENHAQGDHSATSEGGNGHLFSSIDLVTINLYYTTAGVLGFKLD